MTHMIACTQKAIPLGKFLDKPLLEKPTFINSYYKEDECASAAASCLIDVQFTTRTLTLSYFLALLGTNYSFDRLAHLKHIETDMARN